MAPQMPERVRPRRDDVREAILDAALAAFLRDGYARTSMDRIATEAGFTKGAVYSNFASKLELLVEVHRRRDIELNVDSVADAHALARHDLGLALRSVAERLAAQLEAEREWYLLNSEFAIAAARDAEAGREYREIVATVRSRAARELTAIVAAAGHRISGDDARTSAVALIATLNESAIELAVAEAGHRAAARAETADALFLILSARVHPGPEPAGDPRPPTDILDEEGHRA